MDRILRVDRKDGLTQYFRSKADNRVPRCGLTNVPFGILEGHHILALFRAAPTEMIFEEKIVYTMNQSEVGHINRGPYIELVSLQCGQDHSFIDIQFIVWDGAALATNCLREYYIATFRL